MNLILTCCPSISTILLEMTTQLVRKLFITCYHVSTFKLAPIFPVKCIKTGT